MRHDHLDAMQQVSFPDINSSPTAQVIAPPCKNTPIPGVPDVPGAVDPKTTTCLTPPRPVLWCKSSDGTQKNQTCKDERRSLRLSAQRGQRKDGTYALQLPGKRFAFSRAASQIISPIQIAGGAHGNVFLKSATGVARNPGRPYSKAALRTRDRRLCGPMVLAVATCQDTLLCTAK
jgi:hypothetical protein